VDNGLLLLCSSAGAPTPIRTTTLPYGISLSTGDILAVNAIIRENPLSAILATTIDLSSIGSVPSPMQAMQSQ
jgi:hypothetical protein